MRLLEQTEYPDFPPKIGEDELLLATTRQELIGCANAISQALRAVDEWEFDTLVGLLPEEARSLREEIRAILQTAFRPE